MSDKTSKTENRTGRAVAVLGAVLAVAAVLMLAALCLPQNGKTTFTPPPFEQNAVTGTPTVPEELGYAAPYKPGMAYRFSVCGNVTLEGTDAVVYLTNPAENTVWLKLRVLDTDGRILGETGLLRPGEYVRTVALSAAPAPGTSSPGTPITLKIMGYEPDTYLSAGSATLSTTLAP